MPARDKTLGAWLLACCLLVLAVLVSGGITRLTRSGLSIVEWKPVLGVVPPLGEARWREEFAKYQKTPEFREVNADMTLAGFRSIYWMEWAHRLLARLAGLVFLIPLLAFARAGRIPSALFPRLAAIAVLWALQGVAGWYMVKSGLVDRPHVSAYRLALHLALACALYGSMLWTALDLLRPRSPGARRLDRLERLNLAGLAGIVLTILSGALVAGLKAGFVYNTFPLMAGRWVPPFLFEREPWLANLFENEITVQFDHRVLALLLAAGMGWLWLEARRRPLARASRTALRLLLAATGVQISLGIAALLYKVPVLMGAAHQGNAFLVLGAALLLQHRLGGEPAAP
ncbi:MAG: COX15/CtaA family protein [Elusimicrobia bacterium]|nr:COX15/CtaA family protein [Elusimicrobiota bacterium]